MEQQMQAGGVKDYMRKEKSILERDIILCIDNFKEKTGFLPIITQVIEPAYADQGKRTIGINVTIDL